jgi:hypothetical protein
MRVLKVFKALAQCKNMTLGNLVEGVTLHAFEGKLSFSAETLQQVRKLKKVYDLHLVATDSHGLVRRERERTHRNLSNGTETAITLDEPPPG